MCTKHQACFCQTEDTKHLRSFCCQDEFNFWTFKSNFVFVITFAWQNNHSIDFDNACVIDKSNYRVWKTLDSWHTAKTVDAENNSKPLPRQYAILLLLDLIYILFFTRFFTLLFVFYFYKKIFVPLFVYIPLCAYIFYSITAIDW